MDDFATAKAMRKRGWRPCEAFVWLALAFLAVGGCTKKSTAASASIDGEVARPGSFLAYEHTVRVELEEGADAAARIGRVRAACDDGRFGACAVLDVTTSQGEYAEGSIKVRVDPKGVEPLVALASEAARIGSRTTHAEDLASIVRDTARTRTTLQRRHAKLLELQTRSDLSVSDLLALSSETSTVETALEEAEGTAAQLERRLDTNLLEIAFSQGTDDSRTARISAAFGETLDAATNGIAAALSALAYGLPFLLIAFPLALLWRIAWRRFTRGASRDR